MKRMLGLFLLLITGANQMHAAAAAAAAAPKSTAERKRVIEDRSDLTGLDDDDAFPGTQAALAASIRLDHAAGETKTKAESTRKFILKVIESDSKIKGEELEIPEYLLRLSDTITAMLPKSDDDKAAELVIPLPKEQLHGISLKEIEKMLTISHEDISNYSRKLLSEWIIFESFLRPLSISELVDMLQVSTYLGIEHFNTTAIKILAKDPIEKFSDPNFTTLIKKLPDHIQEDIILDMLQSNDAPRGFLESLLKFIPIKTNFGPVLNGIKAPNDLFSVQYYQHGEGFFFIRDKANNLIFGEAYGTHPEKISSVEWAPNSRYLTISSENLIHIWDVTSRSIKLPLSGYKNKDTIGWSPNGRYYAGQAADSDVYVWDVESTTKEPLSIIPHQHGRINSLQWTCDSQQLATTEHKGKDTTYLWDILTGKLLHEFVGTNCILSPDNELIATVSGTIINVWDMTKGKKVAEFVGHDKQIRTIKWASNSALLATSSEDDTIRIWSIEDKQCKARFECPKPHHDLNSITWSPCIRYIATASYGYTITIFDTETGSTIFSYVVPHSDHWYAQVGDMITALEWSSDGQTLSYFNYNGHKSAGKIDELIRDFHQLHALTIDQTELLFKFLNPKKTKLSAEEYILFGQMPSKLRAALAKKILTDLDRAAIGGIGAAVGWHRRQKKFAAKVSRSPKSGLMAHIARSSARPQAKKAGNL